MERVPEIKDYRVMGSNKTQMGIYIDRGRRGIQMPGHMIDTSTVPTFRRIVRQFVIAQPQWMIKEQQDGGQDKVATKKHSLCKDIALGGIHEAAAMPAKDTACLSVV